MGFSQGGCIGLYPPSLHDHSSPSQGGYLSSKLTGLAYRVAYSGATVQPVTNNSIKSTTNVADTILKQSTITAIATTDNLQSGTFKAGFQMRSGSTPTPVTAEIWINGTMYQSFNETSGSYQPKTYDCPATLKVGDQFLIYGYSSDGVAACYVQNFYVQFGWRIAYFGDGTKMILSTALAVTDTENPFTVTNDL